MSEDQLRSAVPEGEGLRYTGDLRGGGRVGFTDERLLVVREEATSVDLRAVESVEMEDFDWFVGVLSIVLVGFGLWGIARDPLLGSGFAAAGLASLYYSYRKRSKATVHVHSRAKPIELYPAEPSEFFEAFRRHLEEYRARHDLDPAEV